MDYDENIKTLYCAGQFSVFQIIFRHISSDKFAKYTCQSYAIPYVWVLDFTTSKHLHKLLHQCLEALRINSDTHITSTAIPAGEI